MKFPKLSECLMYGIKHVKKIYPIYLATILFGLFAKVLYSIYQSKFTFEFILNEIEKLLINIPILQAATGMSFFTHAYNGASWFLSALFCIYLISPINIFIHRKINNDIIFLCINVFLAFILVYLFEKIEIILCDIKHIPDVDNLVSGSPYRRLFYVLIGMNLAKLFFKIKNTNIIITKKMQVSWK